MTKIALDTASEQVCNLCGRPIQTDMVVYGVGGSQYLRVYHALCPPDALKESEENNDKEAQDLRPPW